MLNLVIYCIRTPDVFESNVYIPNILVRFESVPSNGKAKWIVYVVSRPDLFVNGFATFVSEYFKLTAIIILAVCLIKSVHYAI